MSGAAQPAWTPPAADRQQSAGWTPPAADRVHPTVDDHAVRNQLLHEGFWDSAWNMLKSPVTLLGSIFSGERKASNEVDHQRMVELQKNGTPEERREFGKEMVLKHLPFASTIYKAAQGNMAGAAGDVAGMAALAGVAKTAEATPRVARAVATPEVARAAVEVLPKGRQILKAVDTFRAARGAAEPPSAGEGFARSQGIDWSTLKPEEQTMLEHAAKMQQNAAAPPPQPRPFVGPQQPPAEAAPVAPDPLAGKTVADLIAEEFARPREVAATPPESGPIRPPLAPGAKTTESVAAIPRDRGPVRPPLAEPAPPPPEAAEAPPASAPRVPLQPPIAAAPVAEPAAPAPRTLAQTEAAMAQKAPPPFDAEAARSPVHENGETKSPQFRAEEIKRGNAEAKAQRIAQALHDFEVPPESIPKIPMERYTAEQIAQGATPGWPNIIDELVKHGKLPAGEKPPGGSLPFIQKYMRKLAVDRMAQQLADEMKRSGTVQDVMGVNGKTTVGEMMQQ